MKQSKQTPDKTIIIITMVLVIFGVIMVYSSSSFFADITYGDQFHFFKRQLVWAILGFVAMNITMRIKYWKYKELVPLIATVCFATLILVLIPGIGIDVKGSRRWINLGVTRMQPSELAKICLVILLAWLLERKGKKIVDFKKGVLPALVIIGLICGLILIEPDLGTAAVIGFTGVGMLFIAGLKWSHLFGLFIAGVMGIGVAIIAAPYRMRRFITFLNPWEDPSGAGYQIIQALYALGPGGLIGLGLGNSRQKLLFLPERHTDFIFSIIGEELGFLATSLVVIAFIILAIRGFRIAMRAPDTFGMLLASGITLMIVIQATLNIMVVTALIPVTGMTLPLISSGGASLFITMASLGILLNISRYIRV
ncbi:putative lipid II flippase FtsW [Clostridium sp. 'deep sea']|uniref:putative lipid II flippase FtsW n=1 Tax=Clostridium sp. 'deep sea' TaxID=2779445 RepID=UPI0018968EF5|nr:putative lipid II flippase FtsW [Clostridium sp. 'deep sea']QOR36219.1 putative lipid II flippase FtsW [Clostridium sp. 'deep sea']